jgi:hypothetical protein
MKRILGSVGLLVCIAALMGANFLTTLIQDQVMKQLDNLDFEFVPDPEGKIRGGDVVYKTTDKTVAKLESLMKEKTPVEVPVINDQAQKVRDALKSAGFVPRKADKEIGAFKLDVTEATIKKLKGKTLIVTPQGTIKFK